MFGRVLVLFMVASLQGVLYANAEMESAVVPSMTCGSRLELDEAQIHYTSTDANVVLYATNLGCWECTETLVTVSQDPTTCSGLWVPHGWNLYFRDADTNHLYAQKEYAFGEHGQYEVTYSQDTGSVTVLELVAPIDSLAPVVTLFIVILLVVVVAFAAPPLMTLLLKVDSVSGAVAAGEVWLQSWSEPWGSGGSGSGRVRGSEAAGPLSEASVAESDRALNAGTLPLLGRAASPDSKHSLASLPEGVELDVESGSGSGVGLHVTGGVGGGRSGIDSDSRRRTLSGGSTGRFSDVDNTTKSPFAGADTGEGGGAGRRSATPTLAAVPAAAAGSPPAGPQAAAMVTAGVKRSERLVSLDSFRGIALAIMTFANYGAGGYWFLDHAAWNGLTVADMVFPWFMFMMGVSMSMSYASVFKKAEQTGADLRRTRLLLCYKAARRTLILFTLGMFMANGFRYTHWRIPGVLQYFAFSYGVTSFTVLLLMPQTCAALEAVRESEKQDLERSRSWRVHPEDRPWLMRMCGDKDGVMPPMVMLAYRYEWAVQAVLVLLYLSISLGAAAPGCPRGYQGPGGIGNNAQYPECTGGIHRWIDVQLFGMDHIYLNPTCKLLYDCAGYDPEGALGSLTACTLTYLGLMTGRVLVHFKSHGERLKRWGIWALTLLFLCGCLCGFSQNHGLVPINKNLWSTSFGLMTAGTGIIGLGVCYVLMDVYQLWTGAPFNYLGMNSILFYMGQAFFHRYFPFSYSTDSTSHASLLQMNVIGTCCWFFVAYWCWKKAFFLKI